MAILIKAKMPIGCSSCPFNYDEQYCCASEKYMGFSWKEAPPYNFVEERHPNCPLIEIPDVYIDISKAFMTELCNNVCTDTPVAPLHLPHEEVKDDGTD